LEENLITIQVIVLYPKAGNATFAIYNSISNKKEK